MDHSLAPLEADWRGRAKELNCARVRPVNADCLKQQILQGRSGPKRSYFDVRIISLTDGVLEKISCRPSARVVLSRRLADQLVGKMRLAEAWIDLEMLRLRHLKRGQL